MRGNERPTFQAKRRIETAVPVVRGAARALAGDDGLGPVLLDDALRFARDGVQCLIPGDALPFATAALAHAFHGIQDASFGVVVDLALGHAGAADHAERFGIVRVAFDLDDLVAVGVDDHSASGMTGSAYGPGLLDGHSITPLKVRPSGAGSTPARCS